MRRVQGRIRKWRASDVRWQVAGARPARTCDLPPDSVRHHFRRFFTDAANDVVDRVAAEEQRKRISPNASKLLGGGADEIHSIALDAEHGVFGAADLSRRHAVFVRAHQHFIVVIVRAGDDGAPLRLAEEQRNGVEIAPVVGEIDVTSDPTH